jgi:peptidoglycan/LPS O-acetylase OafA/YrhL
MSAGPNTYRNDIDGLRAIAVTAVIFCHAGLGLFKGGFVGVDIFFVISGYLITTILDRECRTGTFSFATFYERRARRLMPAFFVVMAACIPFAWAWLSPLNLKEFGQSLGAASLFASNIYFYFRTNYFAPLTEFKPLLHMWSLSVEEQYYVIFPIILIIGVKTFRKEWAITALIGTILLLSLVCAQFAQHQNQSMFAFYLLPTRAWELMAGALVALTPQTSRLDNRFKHVGSVLGLTMLLVAILAFDAHTPTPGITTVLPVLGAALIIACGTPSSWVYTLLSHGVMRWTGLVSYSAYLWHQPILAFARTHFVGKIPLTAIWGLILLTFALAYLSWRFVEQPFRSKRFDRAFIYSGTAIGLSVLIMFAAGAHLTAGFAKQRLTPLQYELLHQEPKTMAATCNTEGSANLLPAKACEYFKGPVRWAVMGDSHAGPLAFGVAEALKAQKVGVKHLAFNGCAPSYHRPNKLVIGCSKWTDEAISYLQNTHEIKTVVLAYRFNLHLWGGHETTYPEFNDEFDDQYRDSVWRSFLNMVEVLQLADKKVIVVLQTPELYKPVDQIIFRSKNPSSNMNGMPRSWWDKRNQWLKQHVSQLPQDVLVVNPSEFLCDQQNCAAVLDGRPMYSDDNHLSASGAQEVVARYLTPAIGGR